MDSAEADRLKHRQIPFAELHPDPNQAQTAALFLTGVDGIVRVEPVSPFLLTVTYDVLQMTLQEIEGALTEIGLHVSNKLFYRVKRALYYYTEDTQRANSGCPHGESNCTKKVFAKRYETLDHGCRDHRPEHWRRYL